MSNPIDYSQGIYDAKKLGTPRLLILGAQHMFAMFGAGPQDCFDDTIIPYHSGKKHAENDHICTAFRRTFCATGL